MTKAANKKEKMIEVVPLENLPSFSNKLIAYAKDTRIWLFEGELGAGKTTLIKSICNAFRVKDSVNSPTFSLVNEYINDKDEIFYHFDFYRILSEGEALDIGCEEYFESGHYCFIEWPSKIPHLVPENNIKIFLDVTSQDTRKITIFKNATKEKNGL